MVRSLASGKGMVASGSNQRSCAGKIESRFNLLFRDKHCFRANGNSQECFDRPVVPLRRFHQRPVHLANTELRVGQPASCVRRRCTGRHANVHGNRRRRPVSLIGEILLVAIALLAIYFAWMQLRTRSRVDRVKALYEHFCRKTARLGVPRDPCEGPLDFARRAAQSLPNESNRIRQIADTYILLRYAPQAAPGMLDRFAKEVNAFGARTRH